MMTLAALVCALLVAGFSSPVLADKKDDLERQKAGVNGKIAGAKKSYDQSSKAYAEAVEALKAAEGKLSSARAELGRTRGQLAVAEAEDRRMQAELEKSEAELEAAIERLRQGEAKLEQSEAEVEQFTVETLQEGNRGLRAFGDLLRGESPSSFSERISLNDAVGDAQLATMQRLAASRVMLQLNRDKVQKLRDEVAAARAAAAANLEQKQALEAAAAAQTAAVSDLVEQRAGARNKADSIRQADAAKLRAYEADRARLERALAALVVRDKKDGGKKSGGDSGAALSRPVGGPITSVYGMRRHPITGVYKLHDGTDFGSACGTPIRAAASGTIVQQYYNAGYGNRVILANGVKRGKSIVTTYNHLSRFARSTGARVSRGEVIGYVGTTGYSTGCHLHFMVLANGATTNPMAWM